LKGGSLERRALKPDKKKIIKGNTKEDDDINYGSMVAMPLQNKTVMK
jgi:hypothetical protein